MESISADIGRTREDHYFLMQERKQQDEMRRKSAREAIILSLMEAFVIRDQDLVRELADAGFDIETFRLLHLMPLIQVASSDGAVSPRESDLILEIAALRGIHAGSAAHERLVSWLTKHPSDKFFQTCLRGIKAMLRHRLPCEADTLRSDLVSYCTRVASDAGGFLGLGSRISLEEEMMLTQLAKELELRKHAAADYVTGKLAL